MQRRIGITICSLVVMAVVLGGCATGGSSGPNSATKEERNEAAWKRAEANGN